MTKSHKIHLISIAIVLFSGIILKAEHPHSNTIRIMTFNAYWLWDGLKKEEGSSANSFPHRGDRARAIEHMKNVAAMIRKHNPDIVNLIEIENEKALNELNDRFLGDLNYKAWFVQGHDYYTGQDLGMLSRIKPTGNLSRYNGEGCVRNKAKSYCKTVTKNYYATFNINNTRFAIICLHFLSRPTDTRQKIKREAQADAMRDLALSLRKKGYSIIMAGDFNDFDSLCPDHRPDNFAMPVTDVLKICREMDPSTQADDLFNVMCLVPREKRFTAYYDRNSNRLVDRGDIFSMLDHVLVSPELKENISEVVIDNGHHNTFQSKNELVKVSDHFPVVIELSFIE